MTVTSIASTETLAASRSVINTNFTNLDNLSYGTTAPASPATGERWIDSNAPAKLKWWNGSSWIVLIPDMTVASGGLAPLTGATFTGTTGGIAATGVGHFPIKSQIDGRQRQVVIPLGGLSASRTINVLVATSGNEIIDAAYILSDTATSGSDGSNNWTFAINNVTQTLALASVTTTTDTTEITANVAYTLDIDQNNAASDITALDVFNVVITKTGSPTDLSSAEVTLVLIVKEEI